MVLERSANRRKKKGKRMNAKYPMLALTAEAIFTGEEFVEGHSLVVAQGCVRDIIRNSGVPAGMKTVRVEDSILCAGFIDCQVNGGGGVLLNSSADAASVIKIAEAHAAWGTTRLLPTCISDAPDITRRAMAAVREARKTRPAILGLHIEGPHISRERRGAHQADFLRPMTAEDMADYRPNDGEIVMITVAPEMVSPDGIAALRKQGNIVALGHTAASAAQVRAALAAGASGFTHLFNAMGGINGRDIGAAGVALDDDASWCGVIADGHHLDDATLRLIVKAKPKGKVVLVSDAMPPAATEEKPPFTLYGQSITVKDGRCVNPEGALAGSAATLGECVRHCVANAKVPLDVAIRMATVAPAEFLGLGKRLGKLLPNYPADVIGINAKTLRAFRLEI